ncbi:MAG TPA: LamG-like jellyroll fold domain-containing protein [Chthoniobacteraceae bacterium]|nr:LamG-like jellyroll fold domain-containing protein [Chthoniobacteraceae bacterium]
MIKQPLLWSALVTTALFQLSCKPSAPSTTPPPKAKTEAAARPELAPRMMADFTDGKPEWNLAPGEKRLGWFYLTGPRKDPYSSFEGKRFSILECMEPDPKSGETVMVLKNDMSTDILGAFNLSSGTVAAWVRPGTLLKKGGALLSLPSTFPGSPQRGPMAWELKTEIAEGEGLRWVVTHALPGMSRRSVVVPEPTDAQGWVHVAVTWDAATGGVQLYLDGALLASEPMEDGPAVRPDGETWPLERLRIHGDPKRALKQLAIYDRPLTADGVRALYRGEPVAPAMVQAAAQTPENRPAAWSEAPAQALVSIPAGEAVRLVQAVVLDAREEGRRAGGWLAVDGVKGSAFPWWYHGYRQTAERELVVTLDPDSRPDYVTGSGDFKGTLSVSDAAGREAATVTLDGTGRPWFGMALDRAAGAASYTLHQKDPKTALEEIAFYRVEPQAAAPEGTLRSVALSAKGPLALPSPFKQRELRSRYHPSQQQSLNAAAAGASAAGIPLAPFETWHLVSPPEEEDYPLGEVGLRLAPGTLEKPVRAKVVVHDPLSPWRDLAVVHLVLEPGAGERMIWLDLRDTLLPKGEQLWVSVSLDQAVVLEPGQSDGSGSQLVLAPARDAKKALALWREWEWRTVRDHFESISEPRPWASITGEFENAWWLRLFTPAYERLDLGVRRLLGYFPEDPLFRATFQFTHPHAEQDFSAIPVPGAEGDAPRWAVLMRENLRLYRQFVDWWIDHRQHPNGEFGHWYGDDTDLLQEWVNLAFITDPQGKYKASFTRLATALAAEFRQKGQPILVNGLNARWTDSLHAYEEGLNLQSPDFLLHYGDPVRFQRLLDTVSRYDGFLLTAPDENGRRRFAATERDPGLFYFNTERPPKGGYLDKYGYLFMQPGLLVGWYGNDPATWGLLESVGQWTLSRTQADDQGWKAVGSTLLHGLSLHSGDASWLAPVIQAEAWNSGVLLPYDEKASLYPTLYSQVTGLDAAATLKALEATPMAYDHLHSPKLGDGDQRFPDGWVRWKLSGDEEKYLIPALEAQYRKLSFLMPVSTEAEMSGDRVAVPKDLLSLLYLGGPVTSRNRYFYPDFAVTYDGFNERYAAMVLESGPGKLKVRFYNFDDQPQHGRLHTWKLGRGYYKITEGAPGGDGAVANPAVRTLPLARGDGLELTLPPRTVHVVEITQTQPVAHEKVEGDAALAEGKATFDATGVTVPVYNLGSRALGGVAVRLLSAEGAALGETLLAELPAMASWKLGEATVRFNLPQAQPGARYRVVIDPNRRLSEITRRNNEATLQAPGPEAETGAEEQASQ